MKLTPEQLLENWELHKKIIDSFIESPRKQAVLDMYEYLEDKIILAPASGRAFYHNAFPGGYVDHVNRVVQYSIKVKQLWESLGAVIDFTDEELVVSALFHDLGKIGDGELVGYIPQSDKWRLEKLQEVYTHNPDLPFMLIQDRSLFILQKFDISLSLNEYLAIRTHDGLYDDANKPYFISSQPESKLRTNIVYILHQADFMAARIEYQNWLNSPKEPKSSSKKEIPGSTGLMNLVKDL